jgi:nucleoside-diphosphate-sugar epimerase
LFGGRDEQYEEEAMKVLLTGGFGTVGLSILDLLIAKGHEVTVFEIRNKNTMRQARRYSSGLAAILFGDIRNASDVDKAVAGQDVVVHCAAIVPPYCDENEKLCFDVNVGGTQNIVRAITKQDNAAPLVYISSASVMGPTQDREPPVSVTDPVNPIDSYAQSKVDAENLVRISGIRYCILRLGAVMIRSFVNNIQQFKLAFEIPLRARCEVVVDFDVATGVVHAAEIMSEDGLIDGATYFIGGGKQNGCQITALEMYEAVFTPLGIKVPPASLFSDNLNNYYLDWYDTEQAQQILSFQNHSLDEYRAILREKYRLLVPLTRLASPAIDMYFRSQSPYGSKARR